MKRMTTVLFCLASLSCSTAAFTVHDRWEGWGDDRLRVYVQPEQEEPMPGTGEREAGNETPSDKEYIRMALERATFLAGQNRSAVSSGLQNEGLPEIDTASGRVVYKKCDEDSCEAFVDFSYAARTR